MLAQMVLTMPLLAKKLRISSNDTNWGTAMVTTSMVRQIFVPRVSLLLRSRDMRMPPK